MIVYVCNPRILEAEKKIKQLRATPRKHSEFKNSLSDQTQAQKNRHALEKLENASIASHSKTKKCKL